ncbi:MAG: hydroxymethylbilane synthase [Flavobacteriaceae bacterium]|nr:hydroxymethylbilane synthase [Flavobacteriaceae bacterium]|tara:strand:+ start:951 stop:1844 length:894 start_codon:yes stop_codon:yes gene_type:complete
MNKLVRIGTRGSALALWQARQVQNMLGIVGHRSELVPISASGDKALQKPLYEMGVQGIFTKELDAALLEGQIDVAVHSMKDVPTQLPKGITTAFIPKRGPVADVFIYKNEAWEGCKSVVATSSLRRAAQWMHKYPHHSIIDIRGNVPTRLKKLGVLDCEGTIMAIAGLKRLEILPKRHAVLDWMVPAPAQGALLVTALESSKDLLAKLSPLNDDETALCVAQERIFLRELEGGCTAPIGALAKIEGDQIHFVGKITQKGGKEQLVFDQCLPIENAHDIGTVAAKKLLSQDAKALLNG